MSSRARVLFLPLLALLLFAGQSCVPLPYGADARPALSGPPSPRSVKFGAYVGYGSDGIARIAGLGTWLGRSTPTVGHAYLPGDRWSNIEGAPGYLAHWAKWRAARKDRLFVLNVPLLERNEAHLPDATVRAELRRGARGLYDAHFRALARRLVSLGLRDTVLVLGWEMNGITYTHRCGPDPASWKKYWVRIVNAMRSVPGQRFRFEFTPNRGRDAIPWPRCYPGDRHVDVIGMDAYDSPRGMSFTAQLTEPYGLREHVRFARAHRKPIAFPEWGLYENGDNSAYVRGMLMWMARQKPLYQTISDYCPHGVWRCRSNPKSSAAYRALMSKK
ncbi:glycoside hydrolase family 26 protein [Streptomyces acidiscabies]|uniref:glycoside hydrolase family 26 protein n=1 Tax=Streptomyces acidiscabies TaxID=42234 RepID=UPI0038F76FFE